MATTIVQGFQAADSASKGLSWIQKDPSDKKDYQRDWTAFLAVGETISSVVWALHDNDWVVLTGAAGELKQPSSPSASNTTTTATVWLESGTAGVKYLVTCRMTSSAGRIVDDSFQVRVLQR